MTWPVLTSTGGFAMCWGENDLVGDLYQTARVVGFFLALFTAMKSSALCALADWF